MKKTFCLLSTLAVLALAGCGGGSKSSTTTTQSQAAAPAGSPTAPAAMVGTSAVVPANVHCGAAAPVWANTKTKVYHVSTDPLYGKTKHGTYMCAQTAIAHGYHAAGGGMTMHGAKHHMKGRKGSMPMASPAASPR